MTRILKPWELPRDDRAFVNMDPDKFRMAIQQQGMDVTWAMVSPCPCNERFSFSSPYVGDTGHPNVGCSQCGHTPGFFYHSEQPIKAAVFSADANPKRFVAAGLRVNGSVSITVLPENMPAFMDRYTVTNRVMTYYGVYTRGSGTVDTLRFPVVTRTFYTGDTDPEDLVTQSFGVIHCTKADADGAPVGDNLVEDTDFEITGAGAIDWTLGDGLGTAPAEGVRYSIRYFGNPCFVVATIPHIHRDPINWIHQPAPAQVLAPIQVLCELEVLNNA